MILDQILSFKNSDKIILNVTTRNCIRLLRQHDLKVAKKKSPMRKLRHVTRLQMIVCAFFFAVPVVHAFYNPSTGRWLSRDPIEERGGLNVNAFVINAPPLMIDYLVCCNSAGFTMVHLF